MAAEIRRDGADPNLRAQLGTRNINPNLFIIKSELDIPLYHSHLLGSGLLTCECVKIQNVTMVI